MRKSSINKELNKGLNSFAQASKTKARSFCSIRYSKIVTFLVMGKLDFTQMNKPYLPTHPPKKALLSYPENICFTSFIKHKRINNLSQEIGVVLWKQPIAEPTKC